ncbi:MAG: nucleotidyltransferase domain-containing protein [Vallitaleaceae bacterium]|nr:nucleotidyltransferase domain-containing protein [Vallitaleaceae bacterium]
MQDQFEKQLSGAIEYIKTKFSPIAIYLLGSAARNELRLESDVDLAFISEEVISGYSCFEAAQELYDYFKREVDLIHLNRSSTVFMLQAIAKGKVIYNGDDHKRMLFEMRAFKAYSMLNEERQEILDRFKEEGAVYER